MMADGDATENRGVGVDGDVILDDGVARHVEHITVSVILEALGTESHALIQRDMSTDDTGFADDDTRAVVDGEVLADAGAGVYVDARLGVRLLGDDARQDRYLHLMQGMGYAIMGHGVDNRIAEDDLTVGLSRRVVIEHRLDIGVEQTLYLRQLVDEAKGQVLGRLLGIALALGAELQTAGYLSLQQVIELLHRHADDVRPHADIGLPLMEIVGKDDGLHQLHDTLHLQNRRQGRPR